MLGSCLHCAPASLPMLRPHEFGWCMLIDMRRRIQDWWYKQRARLRSRLHPTGGGLSAAKTSSGAWLS